jgi:hypothetical protein
MRYRVSGAAFITSATSPGNARAGARKANVTRAIMSNFPLLEPEVPASCDGGIVPNHGFGRCDRHHKNVECGAESVQRAALKIPKGK